jgi:gliding motility-associated-like protein
LANSGETDNFKVKFSAKYSCIGAPHFFLQVTEMKRKCDLGVRVFFLLLYAVLSAQSVWAQVGGTSCAIAFSNPALQGVTYGPFATCGNGNNVSMSNGQDYIITFCPLSDGCFVLETPMSSPGDLIIQTRFVVRAFDTCNFTPAHLIAADSVNMASNSVAAGPKLVFNAVAGKCYYFVFDANDLGPLWGDCINFTAKFQLFSITSSQTPGGSNCQASTTQPTSFNTPYSNQQLCCTENSYPNTYGNDWYYSFCPNQDGCVEFQFDSVKCTDQVGSSIMTVMLFDTCWLGAVPLDTIIIGYSNLNALSGVSHMLPYTLDSGKCYYLLLTSPFGMGNGGCFTYNLYTQFNPTLVQTPGANSCSAASMAPQVVPGVQYKQHTNCCSGASGQPKKDQWNYTYCATYDGCAWFAMDTVSQYLLNDSINFRLLLVDACGDTVRNDGRLTPDYLANRIYYLYFDVEAGHCYNLSIITDSVFCLTYNLWLNVDPTAPDNTFGSNDSAIVCQNPLVPDSVYHAQSNCCHGDDFYDNIGKDWYYCITPPINGCISLVIDSIVSGRDSMPVSSYLIVRDDLDINNQEAEATTGFNALGLDSIIMDVDTAQSYLIVLDTKLGIFDTKAPCYSFNIHYTYLDSTINTQMPGGNKVVEASLPANILQPNVWYDSQTTCCAKNDYLFGSGMDWVYRFCAPQTGCFGVVLRNWWSSDSNKTSHYHVWINEDLVGGTAREYQGDLLPGEFISDTLFFTGDSGTCFNIFMDCIGGSGTYTGCYNYDIKVIDQYPTQIPGGPSNVVASDSCLTVGDVVVQHNTCCTGYNNNFTGQDWRYCFIPPATGIYKASIFNLENRDDKNDFNGRLSHWVGNNTSATSSIVSQIMPPNALDKNGISLYFCADSGVVQYLHVDDNRAGNPNACMEFDFSIDSTYITIPIASGLGGPSLAASCLVPLPLVDTTIQDMSSCCFPNVRFYKFCSNKDVCATYSLTNFDSKPDSIATSAIASTWYGINTLTSQCNISGGFLGTSVNTGSITIHLDSGQCAILRLNNLQGSCALFDMNLDVDPDTTQSPGGYSCSTAQLTPISIGAQVFGHTNCKTSCIMTSKHNGDSLVCQNPLAAGSDYTYLLKPNQLGRITVKIDSIKALQPNGVVQMLASVYKGCNGTSYINNVANGTKQIGGAIYDSLEISFIAQTVTDSFFIVLDAYSSSPTACYQYNLTSSIEQPTIGCANAGFESGSTDTWQLSLGSSLAGCSNCACPAPQYSACPTYVTGSARHTIESNGIDFYGGFPMVYDGNHSLRLGDNIDGAGAEGMTLYYLVDSLQSYFTYNYAVVFEDPGHAPNNQPFFRAKIIAPDGTIVPCTEYCVSSNSSVPGFSLSPNSGSVPVYYKPWSTVTVDLSPYIGSLVKIEFEGGDCSDGGHFGYAYIDCTCAPIDLNDNDTICSGQCDTIFAPVGYTSYNWMPGGDTANYKVVCPTASTTYTLNYSTFSGCVIEKTYDIVVPAPIVITANTNCFNQNSIVTQSNVPDSTLSYTWLTTPLQSGPILDSIVLGQVYTLIVTDGACYTNTYNIAANVAQPLLIIDSIKSMSCYGTSNGYIAVSAAAGTLPYSYTVAGINDSFATGLIAGIYTATVVDNNGCTSAITASITEPPVLATTIAVPTTCLGGYASVVATAQHSGGTPPYTYSWSNGLTTQACALGLGTFTATVTDAQGCSSTSSVTITTGLPVAAIVLDSILCHNDSNGKAYVLVAGGASPFTYLWNTVPPTITDTASGLWSGMYLVTATDATGCAGTATVVLSNPSAIVITGTSTLPCVGSATGSIAAAVTGQNNSPLTYLWQPGGQTTVSIAGLVSGSYTLTVSNANSCSAVTTIILGALPAPIVSAVPGAANYCRGTAISLNGTGATTYSYYQNNLNTALIPAVLVIDTSTTVYVVGTSTNGCSDTSQVVYTVLSTYDTTIFKSICPGTSYNGYTIAGQYIDTFTSITGCDSAVTLNLTVQTTIRDTTAIYLCSGDTVQGIFAAGFYNTQYSVAGGCDSIHTIAALLLQPTSATITASICNGDTLQGYFASGTYVDTFIGSNGCDSLRSIALTILPSQGFNQQATLCYGQSLYGYSTSGVYPDTFSSVNGCDSIRTLTLSVLAQVDSNVMKSICQGDQYNGHSIAGAYSDTFTAVSGCDSIVNLTLAVLPISSVVVDTTVCANIAVFGYTVPGTYIDTFAASNGCDSVRTILLQHIMAPITTINMAICEGVLYQGYGSTGVYTDVFPIAGGCDSTRVLNLTVNPTYIADTNITICLGDSLYFDGKWYDESTQIVMNNLTSLGCDSIVTLNLSVVPFLLPSISGDSILCDGDTTSLFCVGSTYDNYLWNTGEQTSKILVNNTGVYSVSVSNDNSACIGQAMFTVNEYPRPTLLEQHDLRTLCQGDSIIFYLSGADELYYKVNAADYTLASNGTFWMTVSQSPTDVYLKGISNKGCEAYDTVTLYYADCCGTFVMPNAFTPGNTDGLNDVYKVLLDASKPAKYLTFSYAIYNRWGQQIFITDKPNEGWDGTYKGQALDAGTYYYLIKLRCDGTEKPKVFSGDVLLLR